MKKMTITTLMVALAAMFTACGNHNQSTTTPTPATEAHHVEFVADSAFALIKAQCDLGPRVPGTPAHAACAQLLQSHLSRYCDTMLVQQAPVTTFDGKHLTALNMVGVINPHATQRILLLVDVEDWGDYDNEDSWALGTQAWAQNYRSVMGQDYAPTFGILLDMVGARGARFAPEYYSLQYAPSVVSLVWDAAHEAGYGQFFVKDGGGGVTDDHVAVNQAGIPCIDIIDMRGDGFFDGWHTTHDTLDTIDPVTLKAVGQTLANLIYNY